MNIKRNKIAGKTQVRKINIRRKNKKNTSLKDFRKNLQFFLRKIPKLIFSKRTRRRRVRKEPRSLEEFFQYYEIRSKSSLGKSYCRRKYLTFIFSDIGKTISWVFSLISKNSARAVVLLIIFVMIGGMTPFVLSAPKSITITTKEEWEQGELTNVYSTSERGSIQLEPTGTWEARSWAVPDKSVYIGSSSVIVENYLYSPRGNYSTDFYRYDIQKNEWDQLDNSPVPTSYGGDSVHDNNGNIYYIFGGYRNDFYKYNIENEEWIQMPSLPSSVYNGASLEFDGTNFYVTRGQNSTDFWRFDVSENAWYGVNPVPATLQGGSNIIYDKENYLYVIRGSSYASHWRYNISNDEWETLADSPANADNRFNETKGAYYDGYVYYFRSNWTDSDDFWRYDIVGDVWEQLNDAPYLTALGSSLYYNDEDGLIYALSGGNGYLWKFDPEAGISGEWVGPENWPATVGTGGELIWNGVEGEGAYLYGLRGSNSSGFYRYDIADNSWSQLADTPLAFNRDTRGTYYDGFIYIANGYDTNKFYRYEVATDSWSETADAPGLFDEASSAVHNESDGYVYVTRGGGGGAFYRYSILDNSWETLSNISSDGVNHNVHIGSRMISDGSQLYLMPGQGESAFLKYDTGVGSWSTLNPTPFAQYYGTDMDYYNGKIYVIAGWYKDETWEYTIETDMWRQLSKSQNHTYGRGVYNGASLVHAGSGIFFSSPGFGLDHLRSFTASSENYKLNGTYISDPLDLSYAASWISFDATDDVPENTGITYETRTSSDGEDWSIWTLVDGSNIQSPANRYIQIKITLSNSDNINTPTVEGFIISYNSEDVTPSNPNSINGYSHRIGGDVLISGGAYSYTSPYFSWTGASDGQSGVAGYYVYFGPDSGSDPELAGSYQTASDYIVNREMASGSYYLLIKTKDNDGNVSEDSWQAFSYVYEGTSPPLDETKTEQEDFELGVLESASIDVKPGSIKLEPIDGFWNETKLSLAPNGIYRGGGFAHVESAGKLYTFQGENTTIFYEYDMESDSWSELSGSPAGIYAGGALVAGPEGYIFASRGNTSPTFWRYDIDSDSWSVMANAPRSFILGSTLVYPGGNFIYAFMGGNDAMYKYDTSNNRWSVASYAEFGNPNESDGQRTGTGADSVYDGRNNIYVLQGGGHPYFAKYSIADDGEYGEEANTWTTLLQAPRGIGAGGSLTIDEESGDVYMLTGTTEKDFFKYDILENSWIQMPDIPGSINYGGSLEYRNGYIYALRGDNTREMYRFDIEDNSWEVPVSGFWGSLTGDYAGFFKFHYGASMAPDEKGGIYLARGGYSNDFGYYDISSGKFTALADIPVGIYNGASMIYNEDEESVYLTSGNILSNRIATEADYFMKYDIANDSWETIISDRIPFKIAYGSSMTYDGNRYIYMTRGDNNSQWKRYDTQASEGSRWSVNLPTSCAFNYGGMIVYKDDLIYATCGNGTGFKVYDIFSEMWSDLADVPGFMQRGGSLVDGRDGYLYAIRGNDTNEFYRYEIANNSWTQIENIPAKIDYGGTAVYAEDRIWTTAGGDTRYDAYQEALYSYVIGSEEKGTGFKITGEYVSEPIDLLAVYRWANLEVHRYIPKNTSTLIYTRTSPDGEEWSAWDQVSNEQELGEGRYRYDIVSSPEAYIQVKLYLTSGDRIFSPEIKEFTINYYQDVEAPDNPSLISAFTSSLKDATISDDAWHNHAAPYLEWPEAEVEGGATDGLGGSGVVGYWVYFGTNPLADPYVDGTYGTETNYVADNLVSGEKYYLKIKAVDDAGIIPADSFSAFSYSFDNTPPTDPSDISVAPTGFTATDKYTFLWESDAGDSYSGIEKLQYKTGGDTDDIWYDITNPEEVTITIPNADHPVGAYQSGKNWFYLRVVDKAGNVSQSISQEYYYSASAPSPPENLTVNPEESDENSFSFSWNKPYSFIGEESKLRYLYSVNSLPTQFNTVETVNTFAGPGPFATQKGPNNFYVVAMDEAGNVDYDLYATVGFFADTTAPGAPVNLQIFDTSDRETEAYSIALKWAVPDGIDEDNFAGYVIYRSDDNVSFSQVAITSGTAYVDSGLESKSYYYYVKAKDLTNNLSIPSSTTNIIPTGRYTSPPLMTQAPEVAVQSFAASFNWGTNRVASSFVEFGKSISLGETNGQVDSVTDHVVDVAGLSAATKYFYRVKYIDPDGNIGTSEIRNFATLDPPVVSEFAVNDIGLSTAYVSWKTNTAATCTLKYGAGSYVNSVEETSNASGHVQKIEGLVPETSYQAQVSCLDGDLNEFDSDQYNFATPVKPVSGNIKIENKDNVDSPTVIVEYVTNVPTTTHIYFKNSEETNPRTYLTEERVTEHKAEIAGLDPAKEYILTIVGTDANGISVDAIEQKITTRSDSRPPEILINRAVGKVLGRGGDSQANMYVKIETNEPTKLRIRYGKGVKMANFDQSTGEDPLNTYHLITIPAEIGQIYSYQSEAFDEAGNVTIARVSTVIVEDAKSSAAEIILGTTSKQFGWISELWK